MAGCFQGLHPVSLLPLYDSPNRRHSFRQSAFRVSMPFRLAAILFLALTGATQAAEIAGTASVVDGDTIEIHGERIRFHGTDSPEGRQPCFIDGKPWRCGQAASLALSDFLGRAAVACTVVDVDRYGRKVAVCRAHGVDVNEWTVRNGWAVAYRRYSKAYVGAEKLARRERLGLWQGEFEMPWDWRRRQ
ncbi:MAG: thermonuclease family protein [Paracoccaceae bacterium]